MEPQSLLSTIGLYTNGYTKCTKLTKSIQKENCNVHFEIQGVLSKNLAVILLGHRITIEHVLTDLQNSL